MDGHRPGAPRARPAGRAVQRGGQRAEESRHSMTAMDIMLSAVGLVAVGSALAVVSTQHLVRAGLWLVVTLGAVAVEFLLLRAEFVAWVQVLIYVGAVVVLLLFAVML